jgi:ABC-type uncharacterized transport system ATPase subunit
MVSLEGITKVYPGVLACDRVDLEVRAGEVHVLLGENGAGKSTLMSVLFGLTHPDSGRILIEGQPVELRSPNDAVSNRIGFVQQHFSLIPTLTVAENLVLSLRAGAAAIGPREGAASVRRLSERYGLAVPPGARIEDLSVGLQQRAELLKALAHDARVLILDEPNSLLTPQEWEELASILRDLADGGVGLFLISHKLGEVVRVADRVSVLRRGRLVATVAASETTESKLAELMVGRLRDATPGAVQAARQKRPGEAMLEVDGLWVRDERGADVVKDVSLVARAGEIVGLAGVEGSGQVELIEALAGVRAAQRGTVRLAGRNIGGAGVARRRELGVAHVPADRRNAGLIADLTVAENIVLPQVGEDPYSRLGVLRPGVIRERARGLIGEFDVRVPGPDVAAGALSGGNQQKVVLARELSRPLRAVLCCYPTWGLDVAAAAAIQRHVAALRDKGAAVLYASVDLDELLAVTDRLVVLHNGALTGELPSAEATAEQVGLLMGGRQAA